MSKIFSKAADYFRECDKLLFALCIFASGFGCVAVLSATYNTTGSLHHFLVQAISLLIGLIAVVFISSFNYHRFEKLWPFALIIGVVPVLLTFYIGYAPAGTDDKAWLMLPGNMSFQPSELLKIAFVITFACHVSAVSSEINRWRNLLALCLHGAAPVLLIHIQGDDGTALIFAFMFLAMLYVSGVKLRYFIAAGIAAAAAAPTIYFLIMNDAQRERIVTVFNIESDLLGTGWQQWQGRIALAGGGLFGTGLFRGPSVQSGSIPKGYNDFIFTGIGEELGLVGCLTVILLISAICLRILRIGRNSGDPMGQTICTGICAMFFAQLVVNVGMCLSILPVIGVTLPFFSAGGTSLICLFLGIGLVMGVYMDRSRGAIYLHGR